MTLFKMKQDSQKEMRKEMFDNDGSFHGTAVLQRLPVKTVTAAVIFRENQRLARLQVMILVRHIKARTDLLRVQVPMTHNQGVGISPAKLFQQGTQGNALGIRSGVSRLSVLRQSADVTDSNRMPVMVLAMCPDHFFGPARFNSPVRGNDVMITAAYPAQRAVVAVDVCHPKGTARPIGRTVHDNQCNGSHKCIFR